MSATKYSILLIEDEQSLRESIALNLELENYEVEALEKGTDIVSILQKRHFDLILLDIMLPQIDGIDICKIVRNHGHNIPILLLSAKSESHDRVMGIKAGADDYMVKPFELDELLFRARKLLEKSLAVPSNTQKEYHFARGNVFRPETYEVQTYNNVTVILSKKETLFLKMLLEHKNTIVSREKILHFIWGYNVYPTTRTIDNFILKFRKLFEPDPSNPQFFISKRGVGYLYQDEGANVEA